MTDLAQGQVTRPIVTGPSVTEPSRAMVDQSGRAAARAALDAALSGVELTATERRFLTRLTHWDKREATTVASLIMRAREGGRREGALEPDPNGCPWCGK